MFKLFSEKLKNKSVIFSEKWFPEDMMSRSVMIRKYVFLSLSIMLVVMGTLNVIADEGMLAGFTLCLSVVFFISYLLMAFFHRYKSACWLVTVSIVIVFSFFVILGTKSGYGIYCLMLIPLIGFFVLGFTEGLIATLYFLFLLIVFFWTPAKGILQYAYSKSFLINFPLIYGCAAITGIIAAINVLLFDYKECHEKSLLKDAIIKKTKEIEKMELENLIFVEKIIDAKDSSTCSHSERVAVYAATISNELGWNSEEQTRLYIAGIVHDIGKIGISDDIIKKPGKLTEAEYAQVKQHVIIGFNILNNLSYMGNIADTVRHHHERYDGNGYPDQLNGKGISLSARIINICDSVDAMHSNRIYRKAMSNNEIIAEIKLNEAKQFDPVLCKIMLKLISQGMLEKSTDILLKNTSVNTSFLN